MNENINQPVKTKIPGNGLSIAGMVLGIIAVVWSFLEILSAAGIKEALSQFKGNIYYDSAIIGFAIGYTLFALIPSIIGLPLSTVGMVKQRTGKNITGLVLNIISLIISIIMIFYIISLAY